MDPDYTRWSVAQLAELVKSLEKELRDTNTKYQSNKPSRPSSPERRTGARRAFDPSKYSTRLIALKFAYLGQNYNGLEYTANTLTPLPTIEEELWRAFMKAHLIFPEDTAAVEAGKVTWDGCEYSKCGRTDRGVSAFGQVIGIRVRSNKPLTIREEETADLEDRPAQRKVDLVSAESDLEGFGGFDDLMDAPKDEPKFHPVHDEIPYAQVLNRLLPPDIRALAWCPSPPPEFSARFSCRERRYHYFFTQPAFNPTHGSSGLAASLTRNLETKERRREGWLDIESMKDAAKRYEGLHDFRNFCKVDASKQLQDFTRRIFHSEIAEVDPTSDPAAYIAGSAFTEFESDPTSLLNGVHRKDLRPPAPKIYQFILHGSAFLWHQVRHMVAILFLIGQGLEKPELVEHLFDIKKNPQKPLYEMADDAPLVLWDCIFPDEGSKSREDALDWLWVGDKQGTGDEGLHVTSGFKGPGKFGAGGLVDDMWELWRRKKIDEVLAGSLLNIVVSQGRKGNRPVIEDEPKLSSRKTYLGGDSYQNRGVYIPILDRRRMEPVEVINQKWLTKKSRVERRKSEETLRRETRTDHAEGSE